MPRDVTIRATFACGDPLCLRLRRWHEDKALRTTTAVSQTLGALVWCAAACASAQTAAPAPAPQVVTVAAARDVDEVSYRKIYRGMEVFERNHGLAPAAALRFRLYPRAKDASFDGLVVTLVGAHTETPVALDANQTFTLPMDAQLAAQDAVVMTNRKAGTYAWRVDIRTPGLPPDTRRLGDLRLECKVDMKGAELRRMVRDPSIMALAATGDPCTYRTFQNPFFADRPVFNVTLVHGTRREPIAGEWMYANSARFLPEAAYGLVDWGYTRDRQYLPAIADTSWPDDTLLEFEYMDDPRVREAQR